MVPVVPVVPVVSVVPVVPVVPVVLIFFLKIWAYSVRYLYGISAKSSKMMS